MKYKAAIYLFFSTILIIILMAGCLKSTNEKKADDTDAKMIKVAVSDIGNGKFHPAFAETDGEKFLIDLVFEPLLKIDRNGNFLPALAKKYTVSDDGKSIIFYLRNDVYWQNGTKFTAKDVKFTLEFIANQNYKGDLYPNIKAISGAEQYKCGEAKSIKGIEIVNQYTIRISTDDIYAPFLEKIAAGIHIFPQYQWKNYLTLPERFDEEAFKNTIGTGMYLINNYVAGQQVRLKVNENYWGNISDIKDILLIAIEYNNAKSMLLNEDINVIKDVSIDLNDIEIYKEKEIKVYDTKSRYYEQVILNNSNKYLSNQLFRQALMYAIDRKGLVENLFGEANNIMNTCYPHDFEYYPNDGYINKYEYNPKKAIEILTKDLNYEYTDGILYDGGEKIQFTLVYNGTNKLSKLCPPVIQENLKNIGIDIETNFLYQDELIHCLSRGEYDMALYETSIRSDPDIRDEFHSQSNGVGKNYSGYTNTILDKLIDDGNRYLDKNKRKPLYKEVAQILNEDVPVIFLFDFSELLISKNY